jgi:acyl carrier protein
MQQSARLTRGFDACVITEGLMNISQRVRETIADELSVDASIVTPGARFVEDLGADSLDVVELVMRLEEEFGIELPDEDAEQLTTVGKTIKYVEENINDEPPPKNATEGKIQIIASIVRRRGQSKFRNALLEIYNHQCAITGYSGVEALEAAHINPFCGEGTNHPTNGLLLRADIHTLFDLHLIAIDGKTMTVLLSSKLENSSYQDLAGKSLRLPEIKTDHPNKAALKKHRQQLKP